MEVVRRKWWSTTQIVRFTRACNERGANVVIVDGFLANSTEILPAIS